MEQSKFKKLLHRYSKGKANETETALVDAWYKSYQVNEGETDLNESEKANIKASLSKKIEQSNLAKSQMIIPFYYRIAVAIAIICTTGIWILRQKSSNYKQATTYSEASTTERQIKKVILPDSSIVWLNANSSMRVSTNFTADTREVFLDEGEAFFEVTKNPKKPLIIHRGEVSVKVLGTSFNIKGYKALPNLKVTVSTGKVQVTSGETSVLLTPKQETIYSYANKTFTTHNVNDAEANLWREGKIYLHQASFKELALTLANNFNIQLTAASAAVNHYQFTVNISTDMSEIDILNIISAIHNSKYRKEGDKVILY